jgi:Lrp/AsnC family transcriptional regulator for asnA, asnC and gidA
VEAPNNNLPKLTKNDQKVLKKIIDQAKIPDLEIAKKMGLSQQAIFKIRHKLEDLGIIRGYMPIIDFKKIGIRTLVVMGIKFTTYIWEKYTEDQIAERIQKIPQVITAYRIPESNISHLLVMGFKDTDHKDRYLMKLQSKYSKEIEIVQVYPFSVDRIIKDNHIGLLDSIIDKDEASSKEFFIDK